MIAGMKQSKYAIYPPAEPELPYLAVVLTGDYVSSVFSCPDRKTAKRWVREMKERVSAREGLKVVAG
jgi:hypothetical protein